VTDGGTEELLEIAVLRAVGGHPPVPIGVATG
jgi:hypothetical protein